MSDLKDVFSKLILKREREIKRICAPLQDCLGIPIFTYGRVETGGRLVNLASSAHALEFYYDKKLYLDDQHMIHPLLLRSGALLIPDTYNPEYLQKACKEAQ